MVEAGGLVLTSKAGGVHEWFGFLSIREEFRIEMEGDAGAWMSMDAPKRIPGGSCLKYVTSTHHGRLVMAVQSEVVR